MLRKAGRADQYYRKNELGSKAVFYKILYDPEYR